MKVVQYKHHKDFYERTRAYLLKNEAVNNLTVGILHSLMDLQEPDEKHFFALVENDSGEICMTMVKTHLHLVLAGEMDKDAPEAAVTHLLEHSIDIPSTVGPRVLTEAFVGKYLAATHFQAAVDMEQRIYKLEKINDIPLSPGRFRAAEKKDIPLLGEWIADFTEVTGIEKFTLEEGLERAEKGVAQGALYIWENNGIPVSMANKARPTENGAVVNLVYTPQHFQRKGYASSCVAELSRLILNQGYSFCSLYTDLANPTSNKIYINIGYKPIEDSIVYKFIKEQGRGENN